MNIFETSKTRFISHRGFTPLAPENSLPSFRYAGMLGQWAIETDLRVTRDGEIVCCHNDSVDSYCDGTGKICEMSYRKLCKFKLTRGNRVACFDEEELKIPLFREYLAICRRFGSVPFIELKTDDAELVLHALGKNGFSTSEVVISSTSLSHLVEARRASQDVFVHWIFADEAHLAELCELGHAGFSLKIADPGECSGEKIARAHEMGLKMCLRAADTQESLRQMRELRLDYFPTNNMHDKT